MENWKWNRDFNFLFLTLLTTYPRGGSIPVPGVCAAGAIWDSKFSKFVSASSNIGPCLVPKIAVAGESLCLPQLLSCFSQDILHLSWELDDEEGLCPFGFNCHVVSDYKANWNSFEYEMVLKVVLTTCEFCHSGILIYRNANSLCQLCHAAQQLSIVLPSKDTRTTHGFDAGICSWTSQPSALLWIKIVYLSRWRSITLTQRTKTGFGHTTHVIDENQVSRDLSQQEIYFLRKSVKTGGEMFGPAPLHLPCATLHLPHRRHWGLAPTSDNARGAPLLTPTDPQWESNLTYF